VTPTPHVFAVHHSISQFSLHSVHHLMGSAASAAASRAFACAALKLKQLFRSPNRNHQPTVENFVRSTALLLLARQTSASLFQMVESEYRQHNKEGLKEEYSGPQRVTRGCTDVLFLLLFAAFWAGMVLIAIYSLQNGRPLLITNGYDYDGNICGVGNMADYAFNYFPMPLYVAYSVCVKACPASFSAGYCAQPVTVTKTDTLSKLVAMINGGPTFRTTDCTEGSLPLPTSLNQALTGDGLKQALALADCISNFTMIAMNTNVSRSLMDLPPGKCFSTYPTSAFKSRCLPNPLPPSVDMGFVFTLDAGSLLGMPPSASTSTKSGAATAITGFADVFNSAALSFSDMMAQVQRNYQWIIVSAGIALVFSLIYAQLLKWFAMPMTWITIVLANLFLLAAGVLTLLKSGTLNVQTLPGYNVISGIDPNMAAMLLNSTTSAVDAVSSSKAFASANASFIGSAYSSLSTQQQQQVGQAFGSACIISSAVLFLLSIVLCRQIVAAVNVLKQAAGCMVSMWGLLLFPVVLFILLCALYTYWIFVAVFLASAGKYNPQSKLYELDETLRKAAAYHLFGLLWTNHFLIGIAQVSGSSQKVFWTPPPAHTKCRSRLLEPYRNGGLLSFAAVFLAACSTRCQVLHTRQATRQWMDHSRRFWTHASLSYWYQCPIRICF